MIHKTFESFNEMNESGRDKINKVHTFFEDDLLSTPFIKDNFDAGFEEDYQLDDDKYRDQGGLVTRVSIEINHPKKTAMDAVENDYKSFAKPFEEWAAKHDLDEPEILTTDNSMIFQITLA